MKLKKVRRPVQPRGIARYESILVAAKLLIAEVGIQETTAYRIAERAKLPAASVYQYFPTRELIFETLAERQFHELMEGFKKRLENAVVSRWQQLAEILVLSSYRFYTSNIVNERLFLGMDTTLNVRMGAACRLTTFSQWFCVELEQRFVIEDIDALKDPVAISVNVADAAFQRSLSLYDEIRPGYYDEALKAVIGYLTTHLGESLPTKSTSAV
ncbi:TetR/AcrR family transcriptional regulator [Photobacterium sagamiensis]|uniref:TetR/AcrR family transcriptional regulator n=1 Tax=Photobacterium sagamiensis TaxID=2910241 RepID=UPI003D0E017F